MGDDVGGVVFVLGIVAAISIGRVIDETFIERPGIHMSFPPVHDGIAEPKGLRLHVGDARRDPGFPRCVERVVAWRLDQLLDGGPESLGRFQTVAVGRLRDVGVGLEYILHRRRISASGGAYATESINGNSESDRSEEASQGGMDDLGQDVSPRLASAGKASRLIDASSQECLTPTVAKGNGYRGPRVKLRIGQGAIT